mgnify:CR=1 FL=1
MSKKKSKRCCGKCGCGGGGKELVGPVTQNHAALDALYKAITGRGFMEQHLPASKRQPEWVEMPKGFPPPEHDPYNP